MTQKFIPPVRRVDRPKTHWYEDGAGNRIPGVTTILGGGIPKANLIGWAANITAEYAINNWDDLADLPPAQRLKELQNARWETSNTAKNKGTTVHKYAEELVQGKTVEDIPLELIPYADHLARFYDTWKLDPILVECLVVNYSLGYAGTLDLVAELTTPAGDREVWLLDVKTGEKGIWNETALQLAAYRYAQFYVDNHGKEQPMIPVERCGAIHVTSDAAVLVPTVSGVDELKLFGKAYGIYEFDKNGKDHGYVEPPMLHPKRSTARLVWEDMTE